MKASPAHLRGVTRSRAISMLVAVGLLALGLAGDYFTGPEIPAAAFYLAAVSWASWRLGAAWGGACALIAALLNVICDERTHALPHPGFSVTTNELLGFITLACMATVTAVVRRQQNVEAAQRLQLDAYHSRIEADMLTAQRLQRLLMGSLPAAPGWEIGAFLQASRIVGGDVCTASLGPNGELAVLLADVCGKGASAALSGAVLLGLIDDAPQRFASPAETLAYLNHRLVGLLPDSLFITAFYALAEPGGRVTYSSAGHEPPLLFHGGASVELPEGGPALGLLPEAEYPEAEVTLHRGDLLLCYTDGLLDYKAPGGARRDAAELSAISEAHLTRPCPELVQAVAQAVTGGAEEVPDDITLLALRHTG